MAMTGAAYLTRFIPTRVGSAARGDRNDDRMPVHPHAGGEREKIETLRRMYIGSSPRGWGARKRPSESYRALSVHPHAGGER